MLSEDELILVGWYRNLNNVERLALHCWIYSGDISLMLRLWERLFSQYAEQLLHIAAPESGEQLLFDWR